RAPLPRRGRLRLPVPLRGLRHPDRRGDGERRPGGRLVAPVDGRGLGGRRLPGRSGEPRGLRGRRLARARRPRRRSRARPPSCGPVHVARDRPGVPAGLPRRAVMRVGLDVSALDMTAAGTARYLRALERAEGVEFVRLSYPGRRRAATVWRDVLWY